MREQYARHSSRDFRRRILARSLRVEQLESRMLMNVDWRNPVDNLDVNNDLAISPLDVLVVINDLNSRGARGLPPTRNPTEPFLDATGNQSVDPLDVLTIINYLNVEGSGTRTLTEQGQYFAQQEINITLGQTSGARLYRMEVNANFGAASGTGLVPDLFSVYLVDPANPSLTLLDRGVNGTSLFSLSPLRSEMGLGLARWDGHILEIDLSSIKNQDTGLLRIQLLNGDPSSQSTVSVHHSPDLFHVQHDASKATSVSLVRQDYHRFELKKSIDEPLPLRKNRSQNGQTTSNAAILELGPA